MNRIEYRLKQLQLIISDATESLENAKQRNDISDEVLKQRELFIKKCKDEEKQLLKELDIIKDDTSKTKAKTESKDKSKKSKKETKEENKK